MEGPIEYMLHYDYDYRMQRVWDMRSSQKAEQISTSAAREHWRLMLVLMFEHRAQRKRENISF